MLLFGNSVDVVADMFTLKDDFPRSLLSCFCFVQVELFVNYLSEFCRNFVCVL